MKIIVERWDCLVSEPDRRTPVVVVAGWQPGVDRIGHALLEPGTVLVRHDLTLLDEGVIRRTVTSATGQHRVVLELAHGCVSCTLRRDLLPLLRTLSARDTVRRIVLLLDSAMEPEVVCDAIAHTPVGGIVGRVDGPAAVDVRVDAVLAAVHAPTWLSDATGDETLAERFDLDADDRTIAQLTVGQVGYADGLVLFGRPDVFDCATLVAVLSRLAPGAPTVWDADDRLDVAALLAAIPDNARRGATFDPHAPLLRGQPSLDWDDGVVLVEFNADRPFHPQRLHQAIDTLLDGVVTARGRLWLATQPDNVLWLESAGGALRVGRVDTWLAAMTDAERDAEDPQRLALAALRWDDRFGDRHSSLVVLVHRADPSEIATVLQWALVDDDEMRAESQWHGWSDPFGEWHEEPCDTAESAAAVHTEEENRA